MRGPSEDTPGWIYLAALIMGVAMLALSCTEEQKCEQRGGVYLHREMACVAGPRAP